MKCEINFMIYEINFMIYEIKGMMDTELIIISLHAGR